MSLGKAWNVQKEEGLGWWVDLDKNQDILIPKQLCCFGYHFLFSLKIVSFVKDILYFSFSSVCFSFPLHPSWGFCFHYFLISFDLNSHLKIIPPASLHLVVGSHVLYLRCENALPWNGPRQGTKKQCVWGWPWNRHKTTYVRNLLDRAY